MKNILEKLLNNRNLTRDEAHDTICRHLRGEFSNIQIAAFLTALRAKGPSSDEMTGFVEAWMEHIPHVELNVPAIDICGTGGDIPQVFNISTAAALVVAGAGVPVVKHGTPYRQTRTGSAAVLTELGVNIHLSPDDVARNVEQIGFGFIYEPTLHDAIDRTVKVTSDLNIRTVFDLISILGHPARIKRQLLGVCKVTHTDRVIKVLKQLGSEEAYVVFGYDGMDEITTTSSTKLSYLAPDGSISASVISPSDFKLPTAVPEELYGGTHQINSAIILSILDGIRGPHRDVVMLNAAAGIKVGGAANSMEEGLEMARESIDSKAAKQILKKLTG